MSLSYQYPIRVHDGKIFNQSTNQDERTGTLSFNIPNGLYKMDVYIPGRKRSMSQVRYLFGVVYNAISMATGNDLETVHRWMKSLFLIDTINDKGEIEVKSLSDAGDVTTSIMTEYIEWIRAWAATELFINIPNPS